MLTHLKLDGFKSLRNIDLVLGKITVLIGLNGAGKSSVIQALGVLKQSLGSGSLMASGQLVNLGSFEDILDRSKTRISFFIEGSRRIDSRPFSESESSAQYRYEFSCEKGGVIALNISMQIDNYNFDGRWGTGKPITEKEVHIRRSVLSYRPYMVIGVPLTLTGGRSEGGRGEEYEEAKQTLLRIFGIIETDLSSVSIVPAYRGLDRPNYPLEGGPRQDIIDSGGASAQASHVPSTIAYRREMEERISEHIYKITGIRVKHRLVPEKHVSIETHNKINVINEGFGTNQLIHLFAQIESSPSESLIAIEEPEIHLHPKAQAEMAEVFVNIVTQENKHLLISTHSEHFLFRLLTSVALGKIEPSEICIYYFELERGFTRATRLDVDKEGKVSGGLKGFFETDLEEIGRYLGAKKV